MNRLYLLPLLPLVLLLSMSIYGSTGEAAPKPARGADAFVKSMGVGTHFAFEETGYVTEFEETVARLEELGIDNVRDRAQLNEPGNLYDNVVYSRYRTVYERTGARFLLTWNGFNYPQPTVDQVHRVEEYMGAALRFHGGWNEANNYQETRPNWQDEMRAHQCSLYEAAHDPSNAGIPVLAASLNRSKYPEKPDGTIDFTQIPRMPGCVDYAFTKSYTHGYPSTLAFDAKSGESIVYERDLPIAHHIGGRKPTFSGEFGYRTDLASFPKAVSPGIQSIYSLRTWAEYARTGAFNLSYFYELRDYVYGDTLGTFGMLTNDGARKPVYKATENLIDILENPGPSFTPGTLDYSLTGKQRSTHTLLLQDRPRSGGAFYLLAWQEVKSWDPKAKRRLSITEDQMTLNLGSRASKVELFRPHRIGSTSPRDDAETHPSRVVTNTRSVNVAVPDEVIVVKVTP